MRSPAELYRRWLPFGMLASHSRCHGQPPREPWEYGEQFMNDFRAAVEMKYKLMPYVYAQAKDCSERGLPMLRALFVEYPKDPGAWLVEDEYLFGSGHARRADFRSEREGTQRLFAPRASGLIINQALSMRAAGVKSPSERFLLSSWYVTARFCRKLSWRNRPNKWIGRNWI